MPTRSRRPVSALRDPFKVSLRTAILGVIVASTVLSGVLIHLTWWRTAGAVSRDLVDTLEVQITDAVIRDWWGQVLEVQGLSRTIQESLTASDAPEGDERVLAVAAAAFAKVSWLVYVPAVGDAIAVKDLGADRVELFAIEPTGRVRSAAQFARRDLASLATTGPIPSALSVFDQAWLVDARIATEPGWIDVGRTPDGLERAVAYAQPAADGAVIAAMIGYSRFANLLGGIPVGRTGRSYVLGPAGEIVIASSSAEAPRRPEIDAVALAGGRLVAMRPESGLNISEKARLSVDKAGYAIGLTPLWFRGWQLAVIIPEIEFLGEINATIRRVAAGLAFFILMAGALGVIAARRLVATPIARLVTDLGHIERFELDIVPRRHSRLAEIDRLSEAIVRLSAGLANFGKFIHFDLVRSLVAEGVRAEPGGSRREVTLLFADLAGFSALSERLGDGIVPVVSGYLDLASRAITAERGTIDKFIGDAVMAFWGAPRPEPEQALQACKAALAIAGSIGSLPLPAVVTEPFRVRIGIQSGPAIVGNVGSASRLNYTALGDTVNLASRLEAVNKVFGTTILIGAATARQSGRALVLREVDTVAVYGRAEAETIFELLGLAADMSRPEWAGLYEEALGAYRRRHFADALALLERVDRLRPDDGPSARLASSCRRLLAEPPAHDWRPVTTLDFK